MNSKACPSRFRYSSSWVRASADDAQGNAISRRVSSSLPVGHPVEIAFDGSQGGSRMWPEHDVAVVVFRPELAFVLKPFVEPDFGELVLPLHVITGGLWVLRLGD